MPTDFDVQWSDDGVEWITAWSESGVTWGGFEYKRFVNPMTVERHCAERDLAPLLLTDNDAFQLFRGRRMLFEFLPARADHERFAAELDWRLFTLRRLALIRRKWRPVRVIAFGRPVPRSSSCGSTRRSRRRRSRRP